jgi:hypothetical protein
MTKADREAELLEMTWQAVKAIAEPLGIEKPSGGWDEAVPSILAIEFPEGPPVEPEVERSPSGVAEFSDAAGFVYASAFFESSGIPYCKACGASYQNDLEGNPVCPVSNTECPRLSQ